jgi:hypothetical protein
MSEDWKKYKGRQHVRAGDSSTVRDGRQNKRIGAWEFTPKPNTTLEKLEKFFLASLVAVDQVTHRRDEAIKSNRFTPEGVGQDVLQFALKDVVPVLGRARASVRQAKSEVETLREKTKLKSVDTSDPWRCGLMLRSLDAFRAMSQKERDELTRSPEKLDPIMVDAILSAPASLSGVSPTHRQQLVDRALEAEHGPALVELATLEQAIAIAETAIETARDEVRAETGITDRSKFDQLAAPIEQKTSAAWLRPVRRLIDGTTVHEGKVSVVDLDRRIERPATEAEIETGVYAKDFDEYAKLTGRAA